MVSMKMQGFAAAKRALSGFARAQEKHMNKAILKCLVVTQREARIESPIRTGFLRSNIVFDRPRAMRGRLESRAVYSLRVHEGGGGITPNPFMDRAVRRAQPKYAKFFKRAQDDTLKDIVRKSRR